MQKRHKEQRDLLDEGEFLGGFAKDDKVPGTISLVIYYGKKPWDGAKDLYEILDLSGIPEDLKNWSITIQFMCWKFIGLKTLSGSRRI